MRVSPDSEVFQMCDTFIFLMSKWKTHAICSNAKIKINKFVCKLKLNPSKFKVSRERRCIHSDKGFFPLFLICRKTENVYIRTNDKWKLLENPRYRRLRAKCMKFVFSLAPATTMTTTTVAMTVTTPTDCYFSSHLGVFCLGTAGGHSLGRKIISWLHQQTAQMKPSKSYICRKWSYLYLYFI